MMACVSYGRWSGEANPNPIHAQTLMDDGRLVRPSGGTGPEDLKNTCWF